MSTIFIAGQRWISNPEPDLGLGIILEAENRRVVIAFPAAEEERTYAAAAAPLSRVLFQVGDNIDVPNQGPLTVTEQQEHNGCIVYFAEDENGDVHPVPEQILSANIKLSNAKERLLAGQVEHHRRFALRAATLEQQNTSQAASTRGLLGPRVQLLPHQMYIAAEVASRPTPRVLLADEVGLGKTIEAGLIIHQLLLLERAKRVLIVVPDSLVHQWLVEMLRRFNLKFSIFNEARCQLIDKYEDDPSSIFFDEEASKEQEENPFEDAQLVICPLSWISSHERRQQQLCDAGWDMLVVDEAHHLHWHEDGDASPEYKLVERLSAEIASVLLLTATPENAGIDGHFARLRLLDPVRYPDLAAFLEEQSHYEEISELIQGLSDSPDTSLSDVDFCQRLETLLGKAQFSALQKNPSPEQLDKTIRDLLDRFGTGRMLFRNTRASVGGFPERILHEHPLTVPSGYEQACTTATIEETLHPEQLLGAAWLKADPRVSWVEKFLLQNPDDKVLLIAADSSAARDLELHLRLRRGIASAVFHEELSLIERDRAAAYFADSEDGAQLLICSEIGSEGRNFQFAQHLILFDLPLNPDLLEQRIGRLDRIGQLGDVNLHVPYYAGSAQEKLLSWYRDAVNIFKQPCTVGNALMLEFGDDLHSALTKGDNNPINDVIALAADKAIELQENLRKGRNRLLELNSCQPQRAAELISALETEQRSDTLAEYVEMLAEQFGLEHEDHSDNAVILRPGDHMITEAFPHLPDDGITGTFDRDRALSREDMAYFSWEHPLVSGAMDLVMSSDFGSASICTISVKALKPGTLLLESFFSPTLQAPAWLQLQGYLPAQSFRLVTDQQNRNLSNAVAHSKLNQLAQGVKKTLMPVLLREVRTSITAMIPHIETLAEDTTKAWVKTATENYKTDRDNERERLQSLMSRNPHVAPQELEAFDRETTLGMTALQSLQLNMSALRLAIVSQ
ncbi:RNA polymerase-associated protein RapA [Zhongshania aliphaticivorans]|uniref:RNA polymerase-associated protein RapA n=1 Tax=Zhongshania aliphaticivorans TaxID=1470434 RepID=A0A5S9QIW4_9GAMM|nr:RNA polymerase-associated protein RapA [Zhongshania aliphaticivorans]CAA0109289.1 RNA polymerase-associated protein RapA [Zhongshania aliphaticivorans]CAA0117521.1 RNA polymerase-associated protein RapA [Zhongshania aliphaticivorans]